MEINSSEFEEKFMGSINKSISKIVPFLDLHFFRFILLWILDTWFFINIFDLFWHARIFFIIISYTYSLRWIIL